MIQGRGVVLGLVKEWAGVVDEGVSGVWELWLPHSGPCSKDVLEHHAS